MLEQHYRTLGIPRNAGLAQVKSAYRKLVQAWHPDRHNDNPRMRKLAEETLKDANLAYREIVRHLASTGPPTGSAVKPGAAPPKPPPTVVDELLRTGRRLLNLLRDKTRSPEPSGSTGPAQRRVAPSPTAKERFAATFDKVLSEVAGSHGLRYSSTGTTARRKKRRATRWRQPDQAAGSRREEPGPVGPVDPVGPVAPVRRKR